MTNKELAEDMVDRKSDYERVLELRALKGSNIYRNFMYNKRNGILQNDPYGIANVVSKARPLTDCNPINNKTRVRHSEPYSGFVLSDTILDNQQPEVLVYIATYL